MSPIDQPIAAPADDLGASVPQRYLALLADVAERLLAAADPAVMVDELFALIRRELRLDVFFNYRLDEDRLRLEAHGGLTPEQAASGAELLLGQAICGCVARDRKMRHATAIQASADPLQDFVRGLGLDAYACTPLMHGDRLLGTLGFGRRWASRFSPDELSFLQAICHYVALAKYRLGIEEALRDGVAAREQLLAELNHRVRNALQVAVGLVGVELGGAPADARAPLRRALDRLQVLALSHRPLYAGTTPDAIDIGLLLQGLLEDETLRALPGRLRPAPAVVVETAAALALLVRELLAARGTDAPVTTIDVAGQADCVALRFHGIDALPTTSRLSQALIHQLRARFHVEDGALCLESPVAVAHV